MPSGHAVCTKNGSTFLLLVAGIACAAVPCGSLAQTNESPVIKVKSHEVVLPIKVIRETRSVGAAVGPNGEPQLVWVYRADEETGLSAKSVHVFVDGVETKIQHFSFERVNGWEVADNIGHHLAYSCTPRGIWVGPDIKRGKVNDSRTHTYLVTYVPPPSPIGSCHRISIKVHGRHTTVLAPSQYCNTKDPLSDPLKDTDLGNKLLANANSNQVSGLPLSVEVNSFAGPSGDGRINLIADLPADLLERHWDGIHLVTSIAVLGLIFDRKGTLVSRFSDIACAPAESSIGYQGPLPLASDKEDDERTVIPSGYQTQVDLSPGDYLMEFLLTDGEKLGRASVSFTVADFSSSALSLSDIALCKRYYEPTPGQSGPTRAPQYVPLMFDGHELTPVGDTHFKKGDGCVEYIEIYRPQAGPASSTFYLELKLVDTRTGELRIATGLRPVDSASSANSAIPVVQTLFLEKLPPGTYRLEAQASDSAGRKSDWRTTSFTVE